MKVRGKLKPASKAWMHRHVSDPYVRKAQVDGYRSRAAYKLLELIDRDHLVRKGDWVVDLGAAPGSWSQVIAPRVGPQGRLIAVDIDDIEPLPDVTRLKGDIQDLDVLSDLSTLLAGRSVDLVLSDMAPNLSGVSSTDQARSLELWEMALEFSVKHLKTKGIFLVKVFQGEGFQEFQAAMRGLFETVVSRKPGASRESSSEVYLLGKGLKRK